MNHLTDDQLSALLDDALAAGERAACDEHLESCESCRARVAELSALGESLERSLAHDPGEAYFASFADRVGERIAAEGASSGAAASNAHEIKHPSPWAWWFSPRGVSFAGGMAALVLAAGLAWLRFGYFDVATSTLQSQKATDVGATLRAESAPDSVVPLAPSAERFSPPAAMPHGAREARQLANGESAPVLRALAGTPSGVSESEGSPPAASTLAQMKARAVAPAADAAPTPIPAPSNATWGSVKTIYDRPTPNAPAPGRAPSPAPAPAPEKDAPVQPLAKSLTSNDALSARELRADGAKLQLDGPAPLATPCGVISDTRGTPISAAQITLLGRTTRTTRSAPGGTFCLEQPAAGDTLILMHVGFEPLRVVLTPAMPMSFALEPVGTLGPQAGMLLGGKGETSFGAPAPGAGKLSTFRFLGGEKAPAPDVYASESKPVLAAVAAARALSATARRERTVEAFEKASASWTGIGSRTSGPASLDARFQALAALREAYQLEPDAARAGRLRTALAAFVSASPDSLPERAIVRRWQGDSRLKSTYR